MDAKIYVIANGNLSWWINEVIIFTNEDATSVIMCHNGKIPIHVNIIADFYKFRSRFVNDSGFWGAKNAVMAYFDAFMSEIFNKSLIVLVNVTVF